MWQFDIINTILFIVICFYHAGVPLQTRDLCSWHCKKSLEICSERLRWVSGYILALITKKHTIKPPNNIFTDVQQDARGQNWSLCLKMLAATVQWLKMLAFIMHTANLLAEHWFHHLSLCFKKALLSMPIPASHWCLSSKGEESYERENPLGQRGRKVWIATLSSAEQSVKITPRTDNQVR